MLGFLGEVSQVVILFSEVLETPAKNIYLKKKKTNKKLSVECMNSFEYWLFENQDLIL